MLGLLLLLAVTAMSLNVKAGMQARMAANGQINAQTYLDQLAVIERSVWVLMGDPSWRVPAGGNYTYQGRTYSRKVFGPDTATYTALSGYSDAAIVSVQSPNSSTRVNQTFRYNIDTPFLIRTPRQVARDSAGNIFFTDQDNHSVWKIGAATGAITRIAGNGTSGFSGEGGPATLAQLNSPRGVAVDSQGNVYIGTVGDDRVRKVTAGSGFISTVVNTSGSGGSSGDGGQATAARIRNPYGLGVDFSGNIYIADTDNNRIRKVTTATGIISTIVNTAGHQTSTPPDFTYPLGDGGDATAATLKGPRSVFVDAAGDIYIADTGNDRIRKVTVATGIITTIAGTLAGYSGDGGAATAAKLQTPEDVCVDTAGSIYIADRDNHRIRKVTAGTISTIAGTGTAGYSGDGGVATSAKIDTPRGLAVKNTGEVIIADTGNSCLRQVAATTISTLPMTAGPGLSSPDGVDSYYEAAQMKLFLYIADQDNHRIRKLDTVTNTIVTVAGTGNFGSAGDGGQATAAQLNAPSNVAFDSSGSIYIADTANNKIRKVTTATGVISTIAGTGTAGFFGDGGDATAAKLDGPEGVFVNAAGDIFIADTNNHRIRVVRRSNGKIGTAVGTGTAGSAGDGGNANAAQINAPQGIFINSANDLYIADTANHRIRVVRNSNSIISTVAGTTAGFAGDGGAATAAKLSSPQGVVLDGAGNMYIADSGNHRLRMVNHETTPVITTLAGTGTSGYNGDNQPAVLAKLNSPRGVALGLTKGSGRIYISDTGNNRIRVLFWKTEPQVYGP